MYTLWVLCVRISTETSADRLMLPCLTHLSNKFVLRNPTCQHYLSPRAAPFQRHSSGTVHIQKMADSSRDRDGWQNKCTRYSGISDGIRSELSSVDPGRILKERCSRISVILYNSPVVAWTRPQVREGKLPVSLFLTNANHVPQYCKYNQCVSGNIYKAL